MVANAQGLRHVLGLDPSGGLWFGIQPLSAGVFGVPIGFLVMALVTWSVPAVPDDLPAAKSANGRESSRYPGL